MTATEINAQASFAAQTFALENWGGHVLSMSVRPLGDERTVIVTAEMSFGVETIIADELGTIAYGPTPAATHRAWRDQAGNGIANWKASPIVLRHPVVTQRTV